VAYPEAADSKESAGAPEIEVTPAMIEAGGAALRSYDDRFGLEEDVVLRIFRSMIRASRLEGMAG
jgi:hypothetical protein